jgi:hypothetical protein
MLKRILILLICVLAQVGCEYGEGFPPSKFGQLTDTYRQDLERQKRELLGIEDLQIGTGPIASWNRRISADIEVKYIDGSLVYKGPIFTYVGFDISLYGRFSYNNTFLASGQRGIELGLNGMAVGGHRRIAIDPQLVCGERDVRCSLTNHDLTGKGTSVRKEKLIAEVILTESCIPISFRAIKWSGGSYVIDKEVWCRNSSDPKTSSALPIWHIY